MRPDPTPPRSDTPHDDRTRWATWRTEAFTRSGWYATAPPARLKPIAGYAVIGPETACNGAAVCQTDAGTFLYMVNFSDTMVDVFDCRGNQVGSFTKSGVAARLCAI